MKYGIERKIGKYNIHLSWRYNGFGFMCLWIKDWYFQFGGIKLMIIKQIDWESLHHVEMKPR